MIGGTNRNLFQRDDTQMGMNAGNEGNLNVRLGNIKGIERAFCHGFHQAVNSGVDRVLAPNALTTGVVDYTIRFASVINPRIVSTSTLDTSAGTGARLVLIKGLDANYNPIQEAISLNGQTAVSLVLQYIAINEMLVISCGTTQTNQGAIYITDDVDTITLGIPQTIIYHGIEAEWGFSHTAIYTVKAGYTGLMTWYASSAQASSSAPNITCGRIALLDANGGSGSRINLACLTLSEGYGQFNLFNASPIPEKSVFYITTHKDGGGGSQVSGTYWHLNLVNNSIHPNMM